MEYNQYKCLELYVNNEPQNVFKKGDLVKTGDFDTIEDCENNINQNGYFTWVNTTDNKIKVQTSSTTWLTARKSPVYVGKPTYLRFGYEAQQNLNPYAIHITSLDITRIDTSSIEHMKNMFFNCKSLGSLDLSKFNTDSCIDMEVMFRNCSSLVSLDLSKFNTAKVRTMYGMFEGCSSLVSLDLSSFNTNSVVYYNYMFDGCVNLNSLDLSNFNIDYGLYHNNMFLGCDSLNHIKCKQSFKDWCITNQDEISLLTAMREGGSGTWEIVD